MFSFLDLFQKSAPGNCRCGKDFLTIEVSMSIFIPLNFTLIWRFHIKSCPRELFFPQNSTNVATRDLIQVYFLPLRIGYSYLVKNDFYQSSKRERSKTRFSTQPCLIFCSFVNTDRQHATDCGNVEPFFTVFTMHRYVLKLILVLFHNWYAISEIIGIATNL